MTTATKTANTIIRADGLNKSFGSVKPARDVTVHITERSIIGLIGTFKSLGNVPADQKQALLSKGISEAMNNTAFGLGIAVTCIIAHLFLTAYARRMIEVVELNAMKLENLLARRAAGETSAMDFEKAS